MWFKHKKHTKLLKLMSNASLLPLHFLTGIRIYGEDLSTRGCTFPWSDAWKETGKRGEIRGWILHNGLSWLSYLS